MRIKTEDMQFRYSEPNTMIFTVKMTLYNFMQHFLCFGKKLSTDTSLNKNHTKSTK